MAEVRLVPERVFVYVARWLGRCVVSRNCPTQEWALVEALLPSDRQWGTVEKSSRPHLLVTALCAARDGARCAERFCWWGAGTFAGARAVASYLPGAGNGGTRAFSKSGPMVGRARPTGCGGQVDCGRWVVASCMGRVDGT